jgi:hypothetical protein
MSLFDQLLQQAQGLDLGAVAQRVGLTPDQIATAGRALLPQIADPAVDNHQATAEVAAQTGIDHSQLSAMVPAILEQARQLGASGGPFSSILNGLGVAPPDTPAAQAAPAAAPAAPAAGGESMFDRLKHAVDQDGDGNPLNDIMNKLGGH